VYKQSEKLSTQSHNENEARDHIRGLGSYFEQATSSEQRHFISSQRGQHAPWSNIDTVGLKLTFLRDSVKSPRMLSPTTDFSEDAASQRTRREFGLAREVAFLCSTHDTESALLLSARSTRCIWRGPSPCCHRVFYPSFRNLELDLMSPAAFVGFV
jgi:hypothetical protein